MNPIITRLHYLALIWLCSLSILHADEQTDLQLTLPEQFYAVVGSEMNLYFANTILAEKTDAYRLQVKCDPGQADEKYRSVIPLESNVGQNIFKPSDAEESQFNEFLAKTVKIQHDFEVLTLEQGFREIDYVHFF